MKVKTLVLSLIAVALILAGCQKTPAPTMQSVVNAKGYREASLIGMKLQWKFDGQDLEIVLTAPTTGWVAIGFDPSTMMKDANFILAYVKDGQVSAIDQYGSQLTNHSPDTTLGGTDDVTAVSGSDDGNTTEVTLRIPANSGDKYDHALAPGEEHTVLLAYGPKDDFETQHTARGKLKLIL